MRTWRGTRIVRWDQVRSARLTYYRKTHTLTLRLGPLWWTRIHLSDYKRQRSLLDALQAVLPVPIRANEGHWALIRDP